LLLLSSTDPAAAVKTTLVACIDIRLNLPRIAVVLVPQILLPPQTALFACIYSMQRDPTYWPHALEFRPERWLPVSVPHLLPAASFESLFQELTFIGHWSINQSHATVAGSDQ
jgi:hypothetical protein